MSTIIEKAKAIRLFILDVDGILTNGMLYYSNHAVEMKAFHIHDGLGIKLLQKTGVIVAIISAKTSEALTRRIKELNIQHAYLGYENKLPAYEELKRILKLEDHEIAYMGDDLPDLPVLSRVGLAITVPQAPDILTQRVDLITKKKAGKGAVREVCEFIMQAQEQFDSVIQSYLN